MRPWRYDVRGDETVGNAAGSGNDLLPGKAGAQQRRVGAAADTLGLLAGALALAWWYLASDLWLSLAGGLVFGVVVARWPQAGAVLALWTAPWFRFPKEVDPSVLGLAAWGRASPLAISPGEFTILVTFAAWLLRAWWEGRRSRSAPQASDGPHTLAWWREALLSPLGLLLLVATLSLAWSEFLRFSLREYRTVVVEPALFALVVRDLARRRRAWWVLLWSLVALGGSATALALLRYVTGAETVIAEGVQRAAAIYDSPNHLGLLLGRTLPVAVGLALFAPLRPRTWTALVIGIMLMAAALTLTYSRGAWLALGASLAFLAAMQGRRTLAALALTGAVAALAALALVPLERLASAATSSQRMYLWQATVQMLRDHPLTGVGLDNFLYHYPRYMLPEAWREPDLSHPHNLILDFWVRLGILGLAVLGWVQARFWWHARTALRRQSADPWARAGAVALMGGMVDFLTHGLVDNSFFLVDMAVIFWLMAMLMDGLARWDGRASSPPDRGRLQ
ncbi:MAG: O-antigen ligase family protein [Chloroflexi bacterium]|nr:O-antigen ligase family protein [Chloroflexota bacterium]